MNRKILIWIGILLACGYSQLAAGQSGDVLADMKRLNKKFSSHRYNYTLNFKLYETYSSIHPVEVQQMDIKSFDLMINMYNPHFQVIKNKDHYLYVNFDNKLMMLNTVYSYSKELKMVKEFEGMLNIDTLLSSYESVKELGVKNGQKTYRFKYSGMSKFNYSDISFNTQTYIIEKVIMYYRNNADELNIDHQTSSKKSIPRLEMTFSQFKEQRTMNKEFFELTKFISLNRKKVAVKAPYSTYKFIDNRIN